MNHRGWGITYGLLGLLIIGLAVVQEFSQFPPESPSQLITDVFISLLAGGGLLYAGYWHRRGILEDSFYPKIAGWMALTVGFFVSLGVITLYLGSEIVLLDELLEIVELNLGVGLLAGLTMGTVRSLTIQQTRAASEAEAFEAQAERLAELNDLLRHYLLNAINVIDGRAQLLQDRVGGEGRESLDIIRHQATFVVDLIRNLDRIAEPEVTSIDAVDMDEILLDAKQSADGDADVRSELPTTDLFVEGNSALAEGWGLLYGAVISMTEAGGTVSVRAEENVGHVDLSVSGSPASCPGLIANAMFEPSGTELGLKLFIAHRVLSRFGTLEFTEHGNEVTFTCQLTLADH